MENVTDKLDTLASDVRELKADIGSFKKEAQDEITGLRTDVAVLKVRLAIWAAVGGSIPLLVVLVKDFFVP